MVRGVGVEFLLKDTGQADAADILTLGLLVSLSTYLIWAYGIGPYSTDVYLRSVQYEYVGELCQSFILTSRYVSQTSTPVVYTIGPGDKSALSQMIERVSGVSPLERRLHGNLINLIAEDIFLSLAFHGNTTLPLNNILLVGDLHGQLEERIKNDLDYLSGGLFEYRIEGSYHPFEGSYLDRHYYSEVVYNDVIVPKNADIYTYRILVSVPTDTRLLGNAFILDDFMDKFSNFSHLFFPNRPLGDNHYPTILTNNSPSNIVEIKIITWPRQVD
jgi:hypothetical protein